MRIPKLVLVLLATFVLLLGAAPASAIPSPPCNLAAHDPSVGFVGALALSEHLAERQASGLLDKGTRVKGRAQIVSELELAHELAKKAIAERKSAKQAKTAAALVKLDQILIGLLQELKQKPKGKKDPVAVGGGAGPGLAARIASLRATAEKTVGAYTNDLETKKLTVVLGLSLKHGLLAAKGTPPAAQLVASSWLVGEDGIAAKLATSGTAIPKTKAAAAKLSAARVGFKTKGVARDLEQAHASLAGILIGL